MTKKNLDLKELLNPEPIDFESIYLELQKAANDLLENKNALGHRKYRLYSYNAYGHSQATNKEMVIAPIMNPNIAGKIPTIFSCKPKFRVTLEPGDVIFCFPKTNRITFDERVITLVMIIIKKVEFQYAFTQFPFKSTKYTQSSLVNGEIIYQYGDITATFENTTWQYTGRTHGTPHRNRPEEPILLFSAPDCKYQNIIYPDIFIPKAKLSCNGCIHYKKKNPATSNPCFMRDGRWQYDILFKYGLVGCCDAAIPKEFRSFYLGGEGMSLSDFQDLLDIGKKRLNFNERNYSDDELDARGPEILKSLRNYAHIMSLTPRL